MSGKLAPSSSSSEQLLGETATIGTCVPASLGGPLTLVGGGKRTLEEMDG